MRLPEIAGTRQDVVTIAGRIELYRAEVDYIIDHGAYIVGYRHIYKPYRAKNGAYRTKTVYTSTGTLTSRGRFHLYSPEEYEHFMGRLDNGEGAMI